MKERDILIVASIAAVNALLKKYSKSELLTVIASSASSGILGQLARDPTLVGSKVRKAPSTKK